MILRIYFYKLFFFLLYRFVSLGPRLSSFVLDTEDGSLDTSDSIKLLPLSGDKTIQICGYPLHGMDTKLLFGIPPNVLISEYGIEVQLKHKFASSFFFFIFSIKIRVGRSVNCCKPTLILMK